MSRTSPILVCFAVKEEASAFRKLPVRDQQITTVLTGIGRRNAERAIRDALRNGTPGLVLTCGFAGGLDPELQTGTVVFSTHDSRLASTLQSLGARPARFHCAAAIATTAIEKRELRRQTEAEAVEMESQVIEAVCRERNVPCATVRVILDTADEDLPLDFNLLMNANQEIVFARLLLAMAKSPQKIRALIRLGKRSDAAAEKLAQVLSKVIPLSNPQ